jgi:hypothetical protein
MVLRRFTGLSQCEGSGFRTREHNNAAHFSIETRACVDFTIRALKQTKQRSFSASGVRNGREASGFVCDQHVFAFVQHEASRFMVLPSLHFHVADTNTSTWLQQYACIADTSPIDEDSALRHSGQRKPARIKRRCEVLNRGDVKLAKGYQVRMRCGTFKVG